MRISENRVRGVTIGKLLSTFVFGEKCGEWNGLRRRGLQVFQKRIRDVSSAVVSDAGRLTFDVFHQAVQVIT